MRKTSQPGCSRRERQILDVLHRLGRAPAAKVRAELADPPSYSTVRALLARLERKGHARHEQDGPRYVFLPAEAPPKARRAALQHLLRTFFGGSPERAAAALLEQSELEKLPAATLERLRAMIAEAGKARKEKP